MPEDYENQIRRITHVPSGARRGRKFKNGSLPSAYLNRVRGLVYHAFIKERYGLKAISSDTFVDERTGLLWDIVIDSRITGHPSVCKVPHSTRTNCFFALAWLVEKIVRPGSGYELIEHDIKEKRNTSEECGESIIIDNGTGEMKGATLLFGTFRTLEWHLDLRIELGFHEAHEEKAVKQLACLEHFASKGGVAASSDIECFITAEDDSDDSLGGFN
jgi:hypothetical protein